MTQGMMGGFSQGRMSSRRGNPRRSHAVAVIVAALFLVACGSSPLPTRSTRPVISASPSALQDGATPIDDPAYLAGDAFVLPVGDAGTDWIAPSVSPVMPNGQGAVRVAFLPASCSTVAFTIGADPAPADDWETILQEDTSKHPYEFGSRPGPQTPSCANGQVSTYLQVAYRPFVVRGAIHLVASIDDVNDSPTSVEVLPVFTSADASQPALAMNGSIALEPVAGPEKPRSPTTQELLGTDFAKATLPDGSAPTHWRFTVTGCGPIGPKPIVITARIGGAAPIAVGECSEGSISAEQSSWPLPADGTPIAILITGGTTKSLLRVSEFQWRGDRP